MSEQADQRVQPTDEERVEMLETMLRIREFESRMRDNFADAEIPGFLHLYIGQEAMATGVCQVLEDRDYLTSTHRGHGHCIARGLDTARMAAEIYGKETGYCNGKGGSMHIADVEAGMLGANGIVAGGVPIATGAALSSKMRGTDQVAVAFFGDGALSEGAFHESFNQAAIWDLPLIGIVENNQYGEMSGIDEQHPPSTHDDLTIYGEPYGAHREQVDGMDVEAVYDAAARAVERARHGEGPSLVECVGYRFEGHHEGDSEFYRDDGEYEHWKSKDPVETYPERLIDEGVLTADEWAAMQADVETELDEAIEFARESPMPDPQQAYEGLYADGGDHR